MCYRLFSRLKLQLAKYPIHLKKKNHILSNRVEAADKQAPEEKNRIKKLNLITAHASIISNLWMSIPLEHRKIKDRRIICT